MSDNDFWNPEFDVTHRDDGVIIMRQIGELGTPPRSMPDCLVKSAEYQPDKTWLAQRSADGLWQRYSYSQALMLIKSIGTALISSASGPERPVLILSENSIEHALLGMAAQYVGIPYAPVSTAFSLVSKDHGKLKDIVTLLNPGIVFASDGVNYAAALNAISDHDHQVVVTRNPTSDDTVLFSQLSETIADTRVDEAYARLTPDTVGKYLFTSGSTGSPKAVVNTQYMMTTNQVIVADCFRFLANRPPEVVDWAPWSHTAAGNKVFNMVLFNGGSYYIDEGRPTPAGMQKTIANLKEISPTWYFNVPVAWEKLVDAFKGDASLRESFFSRLDMMMYAGAGMPQHTWDAVLKLARDTTGRDILLTTGLGATETGPFALMCTQQQPNSGNIGIPAKGVTLKLVPNGGKLEARIKSPSITPAYFGSPAATQAMCDEEGFYKLGDALKPADSEDFSKGFYFDGRTAENFKLITGTWVAVGALRTAMVNHFSGIIRDVVIVGENSPFLSAIIIPAMDSIHKQVPDAKLHTLQTNPATRELLQSRLNSFATLSTGSSNRIERAVVLPAAPDIDKGEVTDKGSINQRAIIRNHPELTEMLYSDNSEAIRIS